MIYHIAGIEISTKNWSSLVHKFHFIVNFDCINMLALKKIIRVFFFSKKKKTNKQTQKRKATSSWFLIACGHKLMVGQWLHHSYKKRLTLTNSTHSGIQTYTYSTNFKKTKFAVFETWWMWTLSYRCLMSYWF